MLIDRYDDRERRGMPGRADTFGQSIYPTNGVLGCDACALAIVFRRARLGHEHRFQATGSGPVAREDTSVLVDGFVKSTAFACDRAWARQVQRRRSGTLPPWGLRLPIGRSFATRCWLLFRKGEARSNPKVYQDLLTGVLRILARVGRRQAARCGNADSAVCPLVSPEAPASPRGRYFTAPAKPSGCWGLVQRLMGERIAICGYDAIAVSLCVCRSWLASDRPEAGLLQTRFSSCGSRFDSTL